MQKLTRTTSYTLKEIGVYLLKKKNLKKDYKLDKIQFLTLTSELFLVFTLEVSYKEFPLLNIYFYPF